MKTKSGFPELSPDDLRWTCPPEDVPFRTTSDCPYCDEIIGQERALKAIQTGLDIKSLGGYLRGKYAQEKPFALSASLAFEQSYSGVDGDSTSSTEVYAILSSLSRVPLRQDLAVTGSLNQKGEIQPIGGVNEKIEGFFDVCQSRGLTGNQGVMIPRRNVQDLMLRRDVVEAGSAREDGTFAEGTMNAVVDTELRRPAQGWKAFQEKTEKET